MVIKKLLLAIDYLLYNYGISHIPFRPGILLRRVYFSIKMGKNFGHNVIIDTGVRIGSPSLLEIHNNVSILGDVILGYAIGGKIIFKEGALVGHNVTFINNMHQHKNIYRRVQDQGYVLPYKDITVGKNAWIGTHAIIMPGIIIGDYSIIGAGAVVTKNVPKGAIVAGVPAVVIRKRIR